MMRLFSTEAEGGFTLVDWQDGFVGLSRKESHRKAFDFRFERWSCCPGSLELSLEIFGLTLVAYKEGGPCQMEDYLEEWEEPIIELVSPSRTPSGAKGQDWQTIPSPAGR